MLAINHYIDKIEFSFISDAYNRTGGFRNGAYLDKYPRETTVKFLARQQVAYYENHLKPACERFVGYLFKSPPERVINHPLVEQFSQDCDWRNNSLDVFLSNFAGEVKARGCGLLLVDMPSSIPENAQQQKDSRFFPYLVSLPPERVHLYRLNDRGLFSEFSIKSTYVDQGMEKPCIRYWNETSWWVTDGVVTIDNGDHNLGVCPVLSVSEGLQFPYFGAFSQIAHLSKRLFNMRSELDEILRSQTFSLLAFNIPAEVQGVVNPQQTADTIGSHNMIVYPSAAPSFIAPPSGPAEVYLTAIAKLEEVIREVAMDASTSTNARTGETGVALSIRFQTLNGSLCAFARRMEDMERRLFDLVSLWLKVSNTTTVTWAKDFNVSDIVTEMATLKDMQAASFPPEVIQEKMEGIVRLDFDNLEPQELDELIKSCGRTNITNNTSAGQLGVKVENDPSLGLIPNTMTGQLLI